MSLTFPYSIHFGFEYYLGNKYRLIAYVKGDITEEDISNIQDIIQDKLDDYSCEYERYTSCVPNGPYDYTVSLFSFQRLPYDIEHLLRKLSDMLVECNIDVRG